MMSLSSREILCVLFEDGWFIHNQEGSHVQLKHPAKRGKVTVPHPRKDLPASRHAGFPKQQRMRMRPA